MAEVMGEHKAALETVSAGSSIEAIAGAIAVILSILALLNVLPQLLLTIAVIAVGAGLLVRGGTVAAEYSSLLTAVSNGRLSQSQLGAGASVEVLTGAAAIVLGVLGLLAVATELLISVAVIVLGVGVVMNSVTNLRLNDLKILYAGMSDTTLRVAREAVRTSSGSQIITGLAAVTLGILALVGLVTTLLNQIAVLALGAGAVLAGTAIGGRAMTVLR